MIRSTPTIEPIIVEGKWKIREMVATQAKVLDLWTTFQQYSTLFSDLTREDFGNFVNLIAQRNSMWFEVWDESDEVIVGMLWLTDMLVVDAVVHCVYFDRQPAEKDKVTQQIIWWLFRNFPLQRLTAEPAGIYHATIRLLKRIGFKQEGRKRRAVLIGGKWNDQVIFGITRPEVQEQWDS